MALPGEVLELGGRTVLWQPTTGRGLPLGPELEAVLDAPPPALARRLGELGFLGGAIDGRIPARSRWALWFPESSELWHALPLQRTAGGFPFAAMALSPDEAAIWGLCNGSRTVAQVAERAGRSVEEVGRTLARWTSASVQALQLRATPPRPRDPGLERLVAPDRPRHARAEHHYGEEGQTTLARYHAEIADGRTHFEDRETTLAHAFAIPHPALGGRPYGRALAEALLEQWDGSGPILEIGPGTGELCAAFREVVPDVPYLRLDLSPELLATQLARNPGTESLLGSGTAIPLADRSVGLVICNEVIADLEAGPDPSGWPIAPERGQRRFNLGAWELVREVARVLRPGGVAWISEFGALDERPIETTQLDHPEVSIHFGQLLAVARWVGLRAEVAPVADRLGLDRGAKWLARPAWEGLRARARAEGLHLPARAWTSESLELPWRVEGLSWVPVTDAGAAPVVDRVLALTGVALTGVVP